MARVMQTSVTTGATEGRLMGGDSGICSHEGCGGWLQGLTFVAVVGGAAAHWTRCFCSTVDPR